MAAAVGGIEGGTPFAGGWAHDGSEDGAPDRPVDHPGAYMSSFRASSTETSVPVDGSAIRHRSTSWVGLEAWRHRSTSGSGLEAWLAEESQWQQATSEEVPRHPRPFRVCVPANYPGVQYRRSKNLQNRYY